MFARSSNPARRLRQILHTVHANPGFINLNIKSKATNNSAHRVEYKLLDEIYAERTAELMTTTMIDTPLKQYLNVSPSILHQFYQILVSRAVEHGVTGIAVDTNSNKVVGVTLGFVITSDSDLVDNIDDFPELQVMQPNIAIVGEVRKRVFKLNETKAALASGKTVLELYLTCVLDEYRGTGVQMGTGIVCLKAGLSKEIGIAYCCLTSSKGHRLTNQSDFETVDTILYKDFKMKDGTKPFRNWTDAYQVEGVNIAIFHRFKSSQLWI